MQLNYRVLGQRIQKIRKRKHISQASLSAMIDKSPGYGDISSEEQEIFCALVERNAKNMSFESYRIIFAAENEVEAAVSKEVAAWEQ